MVNYGRKLRMGTDIRRKGKVEKDSRICRKKKESTERGRSGIEKSIRGNEATSR